MNSSIMNEFKKLFNGMSWAQIGLAIWLALTSAIVAAVLVMAIINALSLNPDKERLVLLCLGGISGIAAYLLLMHKKTNG